MVEDTVEAAEQSQFIDISPFYDLVDDALDRFGIRGVYMNLFESHKFVEALAEVAKTRKLDDFEVRIKNRIGEQPETKYSCIPNDRKFYHMKAICSGCKWWLDHYVGAITADKLLQEGSLLLDEVTMDRVYDAPSFMKEIQRIERLDDSDIMVFHAQHGFTWQYLARKKPLLDSYPLEEAEAFCGDLLYTREYIDHVSNDMARECRHGFGHGVFYVLARQQMVSGHYLGTPEMSTIRTAAYTHVWHVSPGDGLGLAGPNRTCEAQAHSFPFIFYMYYIHATCASFSFHCLSALGTGRLGWRGRWSTCVSSPPAPSCIWLLAQRCVSVQGVRDLQ